MKSFLKIGALIFIIFIFSYIFLTRKKEITNINVEKSSKNEFILSQRLLLISIDNLENQTDKGKAIKYLRKLAYVDLKGILNTVNFPHFIFKFEIFGKS